MIIRKEKILVDSILMICSSACSFCVSLLTKIVLKIHFIPNGIGTVHCYDLVNMQY